MLKLKSKQKEAVWGYIFAAPQLIGIFMFSIIPIILVLYLSMCDWNAITSPVFIGLGNYAKQFSDPFFKKAVFNTLKYSLIYIPFGIIFALLVAVTIKDIKGRVFFRLFYFMPVVTGTIAVSMVWLWLYDSRYGLFNMILELMGLPAQKFLMSQSQVIPCIGVMAVWYNLGYNVVIYIAGLEAIPGTYYEAALIDGAGSIKRFFNITLPLLSPTLFFTAIMTTIASFKVFDQVFTMTDGGPAKASYVYVEHIYEYGFKKFKMGESCSAAVIFFAALLILTLIQFVGSKRWVTYDN